MLKEKRTVLKPCLISSWSDYAISREAVQQRAAFFFSLFLLGKLQIGVSHADKTECPDLDELRHSEVILQECLVPHSRI